MTSRRSGDKNLPNRHQNTSTPTRSVAILVAMYSRIKCFQLLRERQFWNAGALYNDAEILERDLNWLRQFGLAGHIPRDRVTVFAARPSVVRKIREVELIFRNHSTWPRRDLLYSDAIARERMTSAGMPRLSTHIRPNGYQSGIFSTGNLFASISVEPFFCVRVHATALSFSNSDYGHIKHLILNAID